MFVDELERFAAEVSDPRCTAIAKRVATPLRVAVSGRRGVGRSTVAHALARAGDLRGTITLTSKPARADVDVYVVADVVKPEDRDAIAATARPVLAVLNKADLIATTEPGRHPHGPTVAARNRCARLSARTGMPVEPLVGLLAVAVLDNLVDDTMWAALQALAAQRSVPTQLRCGLVDTLDVFGVAQAVAAIRRGASRAETGALLRGLSCVDEVVDKIGVLGAQVHYQRVLDAAAELETLAVTDRRMAEFLSRDETVVARMLAAMDVVEAVGMNVDRCDTAAAHLRRAVQWHRYRCGPVAGMHRACGADIVRGSLRLWAKVGGSV
ncbi:hypothetical protein [Mycobacterium sp.]|uniref:hypothetical protein n=1 Tax=Mycobacterium sp. TaxID=1785 RepID=UPI003F9BFF99